MILEGAGMLSFQGKLTFFFPLKKSSCFPFLFKGVERLPRCFECKGASGTVVFPKGLNFRGLGSRKWVGVCVGVCVCVCVCVCGGHSVNISRLH